MENPGSTSPQGSPYLCACRFVTVEQVEALIRSGTKRLFQIQQLTGAGLGCGTCKKALVDLIISHKQRPSGSKGEQSGRMPE